MSSITYGGSTVLLRPEILGVRSLYECMLELLTLVPVEL
jgi:hypothetical protein